MNRMESSVAKSKNTFIQSPHLMIYPPLEAFSILNSGAKFLKR